MNNYRGGDESSFLLVDDVCNICGVGDLFIVDGCKKLVGFVYFSSLVYNVNGYWMNGDYVVG